MNNTDCDLCWFQSLGIRATAQQNCNVLCQYFVWPFKSSQLLFQLQLIALLKFSLKLLY